MGNGQKGGGVPEGRGRKLRGPASPLPRRAISPAKLLPDPRTFPGGGGGAKCFEILFLS